MRRLFFSVCVGVSLVVMSAIVPPVEAGNCNRGVPGVLNLSAGHGGVSQIRIVDRRPRARRQAPTRLQINLR